MGYKTRRTTDISFSQVCLKVQGRALGKTQVGTSGPSVQVVIRWIGSRGEEQVLLPRCISCWCPVWWFLEKRLSVYYKYYRVLFTNKLYCPLWFKNNIKKNMHYINKPTDDMLL